MVLRNSLKVLSTNFSLVWKNMAYMLIMLAIFGGAVVWIGYDIVKALSDGGFFVVFGEFWTKLYSFSATEVSRKVVDLAGKAFDIIGQNINSLIPNIVGVSVGLFLLAVIFNSASLANCEVLRGAMSSLTYIGFCGAYVRYFGRALLQGLIQTLVKLPFWAIICTAGYFVLNLMSTGEIWGILAPMLFVLIAMLVLSLEYSLLSCFVPYLVLHNSSVSKSFVNGIKVVSHRFWRTLSNNIVFVIFAIVINFVCARYTFCASLLFTLPLTVVLVNVLFMVNYYESQGMRFYLDQSNIMSPRKFAESDRAKKSKFVI